MAVDVKLRTWDKDDIDLRDQIILKNVKYNMKFDRGVKVFRLRMLKAFEHYFKFTVGDYVIPPVVAVDGGSTLWTFQLECFLKGNPAAANGPVDDVERQVMVIKEFIELKSYIADRTHLSIGNRLVQTSKDQIYWPGYGFEGKIMNGSFEWVSEKHGIIKFNFEFVGCIDLSIF